MIPKYILDNKNHHGAERDWVPSRAFQSLYNLKCTFIKNIIFFLLYTENNRQHKSPLILDCGHTFCEGCLTKLARDTKTCIACPTCQVNVDRAI